MVITLTPLSENQAKKVAVVALWVGASIGVSLLLSWLLHNPKLVDLAPAINIVGVMLSQIFKQEENQAIAALPVALQAPATEVAQDLEPK